jgi:hypothetical protein
VAGEVPPGLATVTSTVPADCGGTVAVIWLSDSTVNDVDAVAPNSTAVTALRPVPLSVTMPPPEAGPALGVTDEIAGTGSYVYWSPLNVGEGPAGLVT